MELPSLRATFYIENAAALFTQKADDRIQQRQNQRISSRFRERQMEIKVGFYIRGGSIQVAIHHGYGFGHGAKQLLLNTGSGQTGTHRSQREPQLREVCR